MDGGSGTRHLAIVVPWRSDAALPATLVLHDRPAQGAEGMSERVAAMGRAAVLMGGLA